MEPVERKPVAPHELTPDLKAAVRARRELDDDMEDHVLEAFLARVEERVDARVAQQSALNQPLKQRHVTDGTPAIAVIAGSFALSIPLSAIAAVTAHTTGILIVMAALVAVNLLFFIDRWQ